MCSIAGFRNIRYAVSVWAWQHWFAELPWCDHRFTFVKGVPGKERDHYKLMVKDDLIEEVLLLFTLTKQLITAVCLWKLASVYWNSIYPKVTFKMNLVYPDTRTWLIYYHWFAVYIPGFLLMAWFFLIEFWVSKIDLHSAAFNYQFFVQAKITTANKELMYVRVFPYNAMRSRDVSI